MAQFLVEFRIGDSTERSIERFNRRKTVAHSASIDSIISDRSGGIVWQSRSSDIRLSRISDAVWCADFAALRSASASESA